MRLAMNKRASSWYPTFIVLAGIVLLTVCWWILLSKQATFKAEIGEPQFGLIHQYQVGEGYLRYMDQAAAHSANYAITSLAKNGGYYEPSSSDCGYVGDYPLWNRGTQECYPDHNSLEAFFDLHYYVAINFYSQAYLNINNLTTYHLDFVVDTPMVIIARPEKATDFVVDGKGKSTVELGEAVDYKWLEAGLSYYQQGNTGAQANGPVEPPQIPPAPALEFVMPLESSVMEELLSSLGYQLLACYSDANHLFEFPAPEGSVVLAIADGRIIEVRDDPDNGITVTLEHTLKRDGKPDAYFYSIYYHLSNTALTAGNEVTKGTQLGLSGHSGTQNILGLELRAGTNEETRSVNPVCVDGAFGLVRSSDAGNSACPDAPCDLSGGTVIGEIK